jgi:shikimate 5-dehydrogenase
MSRRFLFIGVTTGSSSIMRIFPRWRDALELPGDVEIEGVDLPVGAPPEAFRATIAALKADEGVLGALVTTHKLDVFRAARDLFEEVDEHARALGEISCIARRDGRLLGWAKDALTAARSLEHVTPRGFFADGGHALILGAGGAGGAIAASLLEADPPPARIVITDRSAERLERFAHAPVEARQAEPGGETLAGLPPRSLIVNATGMGKDRPGSPLAAGARFPERAAVWELNYRGELEFLRRARQQPGLLVEDGWRYFIYGWTAVMEEVFQRPIGEADVDRLAEIAEFARPA